MRRMSMLRAATTLVSVGLISMGFAQVTHAGLVGTQAVVGGAERPAQVERLQGLIASERVAAQLVAFGVDPRWATERVASLTDQELARLSAEMERMPAGAGVVEIVGIVFIVLLILELTGVIDIFKKM